MFVTRALLDVNGQQIDNFKSVTQKAVTAAKQVPLMYKSGVAPLTKRFQVEVEYVVPQEAINVFNWMQDFGSSATLVITYDGGQSVTFSSVAVLEVGDAKIDGENELVQTVTLAASARSDANGNDTGTGVTGVVAGAI